MPRDLRRGAPRTESDTTTAAIPAPRRSRREESEEETRPASTREKPAISKGWGAVEKEKAASSDYAQNFKPAEDETIIKFLDDEPFAVYRQHWIEKPGKKSYGCLSSLGKDCPLCDDLGDRPRGLSVFNVIDFSDPAEPVVKIWETGTRITSTLQNLARKDKTSPLNREDLYFAVSRSGKGAKSVTTITPVKNRDLAEDYDIAPLSAAELAEFDEKAYDEETIYFASAETLADVVDEVSD